VTGTAAPSVAVLGRLAVEVLRSRGGEGSTAQIREGVEASTYTESSGAPWRRPASSASGRRRYQVLRRPLARNYGLVICLNARLH
jgi:hypothetical protein